MFWRDADACIGHCEDDPVTFLCTRGDGDGASLGEFQCIGDQVAQYLRELVLIRPDQAV